MEKLDKALNDVVLEIKNSKEYKKCLEIKEKMDENEEIVNLVKQVKLLQKKYVRSNYDSKIKEELDMVTAKLNDIPIYVIYLQNLEKVNEKIEIVKDSLNDYFDKLLNGDTSEN